MMLLSSELLVTPAHGLIHNYLLFLEQLGLYRVTQITRYSCTHCLL